MLGGANSWADYPEYRPVGGAICLWGTLVGAALPIIFERLGFGPGIASSRFVATFVDVPGFVIYLSSAWLYVL